MTKYKALIIGCGKIAGYSDAQNKVTDSHAMGYVTNDNFELTCCYDVNAEKAKIFSDIYSCQAIDNLEKGIERYRPDVISICTPDKTHYDIAIRIMNNNFLPKIIFLEKPACINMNELQSILELSNKKDIAVVVNHTRRFDNKHKALREKILANEFGGLITCQVDYYGGWLHNGVHVVDTLSFLFDDSLSSFNVSKSLESGYKNDPTLDICLKFNNKPGDIFLKGFDEQYYQIFEFDLKFEKARIRIEDFGNIFLLDTKIVNEKNENILMRSEFILSDSAKTPMENAINLFVEYLNYSNSYCLRGYILKDIFPTMKTLWETESNYEN